MEYRQSEKSESQPSSKRDKDKDGEIAVTTIGNYRLDGRELGEGGFGKVQLVTHKLMNRKAAIKMIERNKASEKFVEKAIERESTILAKLNHPNVIQLIEVIQKPSARSLVFEYIPGGTLYDQIKKVGRFHENVTRIVVLQLAWALDYLHESGVIHRDIKMENIMFDGRRVVLIDFGLSNTWELGQEMKTHCGSLEYAAPELFEQRSDYGPPVDIWSLGVVVYVSMTGRLPFTRCDNESKGSKSVLKKKVTEGLTEYHNRILQQVPVRGSNLVYRCLRKAPEDRPVAKSILKDPWIRELIDSHSAGASPEVIAASNPKAIEIAQRLRKMLGITFTPKKILDYINERPYGTTAGCFRFMEMTMREEEEAEKRKSEMPEIQDMDIEEKPVVETRKPLGERTNLIKELMSPPPPLSQKSQKQNMIVKSEARRLENNEMKTPSSQKSKFPMFAVPGKSMKAPKRPHSNSEDTPSKPNKPKPRGQKRVALFR